MKINKLILPFVFLLTSACLFAQQQNRNWYFGNQAGINFPTSGLPTAITNSAIFTNEGCASISDGSGNLLFYTNGVNVWDKNNNVMPNGSGLNGDPSSTQSSVIVPKPGSTSKYYIFTVAVIGSSNGLRYTIVDMSLAGFTGNNPPNGDVVSGIATKNVVMTTNVVYEKVAVYKKPDCTGYWIVAHEAASDKFLEYSLTSAGVSAVTTFSLPVAWALGTTNVLGYENSYGYLKFSPDGKALAMALFGLDRVVLYKFDPLTGVISSWTSLTHSTYLKHVYGVEFSPAFDFSTIPPGGGTAGTPGNYLYTTSTGTGQHYLSQLDLSLSSSAAIMAARVTINVYVPLAGPYHGFGALQLGPDGRIYVARGGETRLAYINDPNLPAISTATNGCNYKTGMDAIDLGGKTCYIGLPNLVSNITACPVLQLDPCCPPWNSDMLLDMMHYEGSGGISDPYTLKFVPTTLLSNLMHAYIDYLHSVNSLITRITITWGLYDHGNNNTPNTSSTQIGPGVFTWWDPGTTGNPTYSHTGFFNLPSTYPMQVGTWYRIGTGIYLEAFDQTFFPANCAVNQIFVRLQAYHMPGEPFLEVSYDGVNVIKTVPIK
jgi:hypothetical protein